MNELILGITLSVIFIIVCIVLIIYLTRVPKELKDTFDYKVRESDCLYGESIKMRETDFSEIEKRMIDNFKENYDCNYDPHKERAALHFNIPIEEVTEEQRRVGKNLNFISMYGDDKIKKCMGAGKGTVTGRFIKESLKFINIKGNE